MAISCLNILKETVPCPYDSLHFSGGAYWGIDSGVILSARACVRGATSNMTCSERTGISHIASGMTSSSDGRQGEGKMEETTPESQ